MTVHELTRTRARRIAVQAQLLSARRPTGLEEVMRHLTTVQLEPTSAVAPSADVVLWSRLGASYSPAELDRLLADGTLIELRQFVRLSEDIPLFRGEMQWWRTADELPGWRGDVRRWIETNDDCRRDILARLELDGPLTTRELPDTCIAPWRSSGWTNNQNVRKMLDIMIRRGEVAVAGRRGRDPLWDLAERVYPDGPAVPMAEARRELDARRLRALGLARPSAPETAVEPDDVGQAGEPAVVDGVAGQWRVEPSLLDQSFTGRAALLSPLDRLVFDRRRMTDIFEFDYQLEMYKPAARRRWGYWAMPVLYGDRLVGKLDATADRDAGVLRVNSLHEDVPFSRTMRIAIDREIGDLADWLGLRPAGPG